MPVKVGCASDYDKNYPDRIQRAMVMDVPRYLDEIRPTDDIPEIT